MLGGGMAAGIMNIAVKNSAKLKKEMKKVEKQSERVIKRTISDFKSRAPGWVSMSVAEVYSIKKADVKKAFTGAKKTPGQIKIRGTAVDNIQLIYQGRLLTPTHFKMKPGTPPKKKLQDRRLIPGQAVKSVNKVGPVASVIPPAPYQISAEVYIGKRKNFKGNVFLGTNRGTGYIPFIRTGSDRGDIKSVKTVSVPQMIGNKQVSKSITKRVDEGLGARLEHHLEQELKKR